MKKTDLRFALRLAISGHLKDVPRWLESRRHAEWLLRTPAPWISFPALRWLRSFLGSRPVARVFEYGCGGSTLFWLAQGCACVSVEHDPAWAARVRDEAGSTTALDLRYVAPDPLPAESSADVADPAAYRSSVADLAGYEFRSYVSQIDEFPDGYFDLVLVDGRARPSCIVHGAAKVCIGGALVLDNAERPHYLRHTRAALEGFSQRSFTGASPCVPVVTRTDAFLRER